jgi:hypothetical protein
MKSSTKGLLVVLVVLALALAWWWWRESSAPPAPPPAPPVIQPVEPAAPAASAASAAASAAIAFPVEPEPSASQPAFVMPMPDKADGMVQAELTDLAGREGVLTFLQIDGFARRAVATVDNLDRKHAPARVWPVNPTPGRFSASGPEGARVIDVDNALRYAPFVQFVESIDMARAAALYRWMYPLFQRSYEELGYPRSYFNDRLVQVIDHLLQTPVPQQPVAVKLLEIKGPVGSERPWVHYQFVDPALEQASAGQKMLMRVGAVNQRRLQARLAEFRDALVAPPKPR